jgi:SAM-dependent methyltransferase
MIEFSNDRAVISIETLANGRRKVSVHPVDEKFFVPIGSFETKYPVDLIELILQVKGADYLCDELAREEDPNYVQMDLEFDLQAYFPDENFAGKRIMDFGSGSGASTMILSRLFSDAEIVGVEIDSELLSIAKSRLLFYGYKNVSFQLSPSGSEIPANIGQFDLVVLSAVYEHLLPSERKFVIPMVWEHVKKGGYLFINMTPHRYFPIEHHTTNLPLLNYMPDSLAYFFARHLSKRVDASESWETYLRRGIRGATEAEILATLRGKSSVKLLEPRKEGIKDRIDLWYCQLNRERVLFAKRMLKLMLKTLKLGTGIVLVPNLSLVFVKRSD